MKTTKNHVLTGEQVNQITKIERVLVETLNSSMLNNIAVNEFA